MLKKMFVAAAMVAVVSVASASISASVAQVSSGTLINSPNEGVAYETWVLQVTVTGDDAWTAAGGPEVGSPWCTLTGGTFYQNIYNDTNPPNPVFFAIEGYEDSEWTSFYTTHLGYPNTSGTGTAPSFAYGPADTDTTLNADWFLTPDDNFYPGTFTIAQMTVLPTSDDWLAVVDMQIASIVDSTPITFHAEFPEPTSLVLLALGGLTLIRRR